MQRTIRRGEAVPASPALQATTTAIGVELAALSYEQGHLTTSAAGRTALAAMALAVIVQAAAKMPRECAERRALARAARELREAV